MLCVNGTAIAETAVVDQHYYISKTVVYKTNRQVLC